MEKIILYGAGDIGRSVYGFLLQKGIGNIAECFCDNNIDLQGKQIEGLPVYSYDDCKRKNIKFVITSTKYAKEIEMLLKDEPVEYYANINEWATSQGIEMIEWNREYCAWYHINSMDNYFDRVESDSAMDIFWNEDSLFYKMFCRLDLDNVIELASGRGRHVRMYVPKAKHIVLVDILQKNIDICKERFKDYKKIDYYCNNGYNLAQLNDNEYSALFSYDSMVHFEMMDIFEYLKDIHRVLKNGGMVLLHHSNNTSSYQNSFSTAVEGRSYMSKELFAYLAYRAGFEIIEQHVIDWKVKDLDCISLIKKL